ncbi:hypothetical protein CSX11_24175 [Mycobacterium goodii]|nr:hypothetical protein CSX11_24175 [Mycolicibacterium goodii]
MKKEVFEVVKWAVENRRFRLRKQGHAFGLYCPCVTEDAGWIGVDGSPRNPVVHAKQIKRAVSRCPENHQLMR